MPVHWDAAADQTLLLKIMEVSTVTVDAQAVAAAWPKDLVAPTPRAIKERIFKIRAMAKSGGTAAHSSTSSSSNTSTPRKKAPRRPAANKAGKVVKRQTRKRLDVHLDKSSGDDTEVTDFKAESGSDNDKFIGENDEEVTSPSLKTKRGAAAVKAVIELAQGDGETEI